MISKRPTKKSMQGRLAKDRDTQIQESDFLDLYEEYGESRVTLLPVGPYLIHAYWEVSHEDIERVKGQLGNDYKRSQPILRFYDVTNIIFDGTNAHGTFDIDIDLRSRNWYVDLWSPDKSYFVDLGFKTRDGLFFPLARSNVARTPCAWPAPADEKQHISVAKGEGKELAEAEVEIEAGPQRKERPRDEDEVGLPQTIAMESSGSHDDRTKDEIPLETGPGLSQGIRSLPKNRIDFDLTGWSEKGFSLGISSYSGS